MPNVELNAENLKGKMYPKGDSATIEVGQVTTGNEGTNAEVHNVGTKSKAVFDFKIPKGNTGNGIQEIQKIRTDGLKDTYRITYTDDRTFDYDLFSANARVKTQTYTQQDITNFIELDPDQAGQVGQIIISPSSRIDKYGNIVITDFELNMINVNRGTGISALKVLQLPSELCPVGKQIFQCTRFLDKEALCSAQLLIDGSLHLEIYNYTGNITFLKIRTVYFTDTTPGAEPADGKSAYEIWLDEGHTGTEQDFLHSLKGQDGTNGINGTNGTNGVDGKSAYQIWLDEGHTGTEQDFLNSLKGQDGANGYTPVKGTDYFTNTEINQIKTDIINSITNANNVSY